MISLLSPTIFSRAQYHALCNYSAGGSKGPARPLGWVRVPPPFSLTPPPAAAQEKGDLNSYHYNGSGEFCGIFEWENSSFYVFPYLKTWHLPGSCHTVSISKWEWLSLLGWP